MNQRMDYLSFIIAGIRNRPGRNVATVFCFAFIAANIFSAQYIIAGAVGSVDQGISRAGADLVVVPQQYSVLYRGADPKNTVALVRVEPFGARFKSSVMNTINRIPNVAATSPQLYVATLNIQGLSSQPVDIYGFDPVSDFTIQPWLHRQLAKPLGPGEVIAGDGISGGQSSSINIGGRTYTIAGKLDPTQSPVDRSIFMRLDDAYALTDGKGTAASGIPRIEQGEINGVLVQAVSGSDTDMLRSRVLQPLTEVAVIKRHFALAPLTKDAGALPGILNMISAVVVIAALPLIALIAAMVAHERQREIGLLKSIGAKRSSIFFLVIAESLALSSAGGIAGIGASLVVLFLMNAGGFIDSAFQVSFRLPGLAETGVMVLTALSAVIIIGTISALWPAYQSSAMNPYDAIRKER